jgi:hypothetical protein
MAIGNGARMVVGAAAAYEGSRAVQAIVAKTIAASSERAHEEVRMSASGMSDAEIKEASDLSAKMSAKYKSLSQTVLLQCHLRDGLQARPAIQHCPTGKSAISLSSLFRKILFLRAG